MPLLGLGVFQISEGPETERAVGWALECGYRHVDTAQSYGNERSVGRALRASGLRREEVFLTTKFRPRLRDPVEALKLSLDRLGVGQVDLYLVHIPQHGPIWAWQGMERTVELGLARAVGVSNFSAEELAAVIATAGLPPLVNQVRFNPFNFRRGLLDACDANRVLLEAYSPLTRGVRLGDPTVQRIAAAHGRTPAQILLRWALERALPVIPKSSRRDRIAENAKVFDFALTEEEVRSLDGLDLTGGTTRAVERRWWTPRRRIATRIARVARPLRVWRG
jgi:diketogulonate reductase-like aldo/keto reductase